MRKKSTVITIILFAVLLSISAMFVLNNPNAAQTQDNTLRALLETGIQQGTTLSFQFAEPIAPGQLLQDAIGGQLEVGDDYVCFTEPWNDGLRYVCTPFSNIVKVTFIR